MAAGAAPKKRASETSISSLPRARLAAPRRAASSCRGDVPRSNTESALPARRGCGCDCGCCGGGREAGSRHVLKSSSFSSSSSETSDSLCSAGLTGATGAGATARCASRTKRPDPGLPEPGLVVAPEHALSPVATLTPPDPGLVLRAAAQDGDLTDGARPEDSGHAIDLSKTVPRCPVFRKRP